MNQFDNLKESTIGVAVFGRQPGYDTKADPIVRVSAARLRKKLDAYYQDRGRGAPVIEIPKGSYIALFHSPGELPAKESLEFFIAAQTPCAPDESAVAGPLPALAAQADIALIRRRWLALITVLAALAGGGYWIWLQVAVSPPVNSLAELPGRAVDPAWSRDGETLAFTWNGGTAQPGHVYLLKRGSSVPVRLTTSESREYRPVWSPDGREIALLRQTSNDQVSLVVAGVAGASGRRPERVLRTIAQPASVMDMTALDWSPDGKWLVSSEPFAGGGSRHLILVSPLDGSSRVITDPPVAATGDVEARFSPSGQQIAFRRGGEGTLFVLSLEGNGNWQPVQITELNSGVRGISWSASGKKIYFGSQQDRGYFGLWSVSARGGAPVPVRGGIVGVSPALNQRNNLVAFAQQQVDQNLWLYSLTPSDAPRILVPSIAVESAPAFSPDGTKFAFVSSRSGSLEVWISGINDVAPCRLTSLGDAKTIYTPAWSADGSSVIYAARRRGKNGAWETNIASLKTTLLRERDSYSNWPQFSADGSLYFISNAGHAFRIWRQSGNRPDTAEPLNGEPIMSFRMAGDRRSLYFIRREAQLVLVRVDLTTKQEAPVFRFGDRSTKVDAWDVAAGQLYYVTLDSHRYMARLVVLALDSGRQTIVGELPVQSVEHWQPALSVSPDGRSAIVAQTDRDDAKLLAVRVLE